MGAPAIMMAVSAASSFAQMRSAASQAANEAQAVVNNSYNQAGVANVLNAARAKQQAQQASEQQTKTVQQMLAERASLNALAADSGVGGNLLDSLNREINMAGNTAIANIGEQNNRQQYNTYNEQLAQNSAAMSAQNQAISRAKSARITPAKMLALGISTALDYKTATMKEQADYAKLLSAAKKGGGG